MPFESEIPVASDDDSSGDESENEFVRDLLLCLIRCDLGAAGAARDELRKATVRIGSLPDLISPRPERLTKAVRLILEGAGQTRSLWLPFRTGELELTSISAEDYLKLFSVGDDKFFQASILALDIKYFRTKFRRSRLRSAADVVGKSEDLNAVRRCARKLLSHCLRQEMIDVDELALADDYLSLAKSFTGRRDLPLARLALSRADGSLRSYRGSLHSASTITPLRSALESLRDKYEERRRLKDRPSRAQQQDQSATAQDRRFRSSIDRDALAHLTMANARCLRSAGFMTGDDLLPPISTAVLVAHARGDGSPREAKREWRSKASSIRLSCPSTSRCLTHRQASPPRVVVALFLAYGRRRCHGGRTVAARSSALWASCWPGSG